MKHKRCEKCIHGMFVAGEYGCGKLYFGHGRRVIENGMCMSFEPKPSGRLSFDPIKAAEYRKQGMTWSEVSKKVGARAPRTVQTYFNRKAKEAKNAEDRS